MCVENHATVIHSSKKIELLMETDKEFKKSIGAMEKKIYTCFSSGLFDE